MTEPIVPKKAADSPTDKRASHIPVLLAEVLDILALRDGGTALDATLGLGGYTEAMVQHVGSTGTVIGVDADERNLRIAKERLAAYSNIIFCHSNFRDIDTAVESLEPKPKINAIVFDLGLSSPHIDDADRGFAYQKDGPLDMRFDSEQGITAAEFINTAPEQEIIDALRKYGEEPAARKIAQEIIARRDQHPFQTTFQLRQCIEEIIPEHFANQTLKRVFQALRMAVNDELGALEEALAKAYSIIEPGGTIAVVSYHSLEEKAVKNFFQKLTSSCICPPVLPKCVCGYPKAQNKTRKIITPTQTELSENPRSRSAHLRAIQKI